MAGLVSTPQTARDDLPAIAAYATMHALGEEAAAAEWRFIDGEERERFRSAARSAVAAYIEANGGDPADSRAIILEAVGVPDYWQTRAALAAETSRREGAEGKLAEAVLLLGEIRELARSWAGMAAADDWGGPAAFKAAADCGRSVLKIIDADAPTDDDENPRPPRTSATERKRP
jgi:hypothetical protein